MGLADEPSPFISSHPPQLLHSTSETPFHLTNPRFISRRPFRLLSERVKHLRRFVSFIAFVSFISSHSFHLIWGVCEMLR